VARSLAVQCAGSAVAFSALALATGDAAPPADGTFWLAVAWLVVISTAGGYGLYWVVAARHGATRVSTLILLTPPATALWALVMFGQPVGGATVAGMAVSLAGVLLSGGRSGRPSRAAPPCRRPAGA
jgi:drug/metabolite transporter (DMT)-like permease